MKLFEFLTSSLGIVGALFVIALGILWLLLPWLVCSRLDKIIKQQAEIEKATKANALVSANFFADIRDRLKSGVEL